MTASPTPETSATPSGREPGDVAADPAELVRQRAEADLRLEIGRKVTWVWLGFIVIAGGLVSLVLRGITHSTLNGLIALAVCVAGPGWFLLDTKPWRKGYTGDISHPKYQARLRELEAFHAQQQHVALAGGQPQAVPYGEAPRA